jgi:hypothetical protein
MDQPPCDKRQQENYKGTERLRCIQPTASQYLQIIELTECHDCPVRQFKAKAPCEDNKFKEAPIKLPLADEVPGYPQCPFRYESSQEGLKCSITKLPVTEEICNRCDAETREREATLGDKAKNYFGAVRRWVASGSPTRTEGEIRELFENHCQNCDRYDPVKHACKNCGCSISTDSSPLSNKLAMKTEHCPLGRF